MSFFPYGVYDKIPNTELDAMSQAQFETRYTTLLNIMLSMNVNTVKCDSYSDGNLPVNGTAWYAARLEWFADQLAANNMKFIYQVGNPGAPAWDKVGVGETYHAVYTHSALYKCIYGDEPDGDTDPSASITTFASGASTINAAYASMDVMCAMIGESFEPTAGVVRNIQSITESPAGTYTITLDAAVNTHNNDLAITATIAGTSGHDGTYTYTNNSLSGTSDNPPVTIVVTGTGGAGNQASAGGTVTLTGGLNDAFYSSAWSSLGASTRLVRHYPVRRTYYLTDSTYYTDKMFRPYSGFWQHVESQESEPYIAILQAFGETALHFDSFRRLPTSSELTAQAHLALAGGARGVLWFSLQDVGVNSAIYNTALDTKTQDRNSGYLFDTIRDIGLQVTNSFAANYLLNHVAHTQTISTGNDDVVGVSRKIGSMELIYLVNVDTENSNSGTVTADVNYNPADVVNIFDSTAIDYSYSASQITFDYTLLAGEGMFFRLGLYAHGFISDT